ncbi:helix-turn-helix domain-containing protein [Pinibacter soli]|uniref:Helix-turn-helix transcriptional regulator n=1 Tax=Pinibacter soli TaxID=3044211 RepID=A0ABT6R769_9BACT|nr:helix-turn-helix transcriptional regulator [Pinibacter soli]MDI3318413.1 helix-turn-helix transcriptional regulator [Pinibacter soli]
MVKKSAFIENARYRLKNRKWLGYSGNIAQRILAALEDSETVNQKVLAEKIGVSPQYISKVVSGNENLTLETIAKISEALGVELISFPLFKDDLQVVRDHESLPAKEKVKKVRK